MKILEKIKIKANKRTLFILGGALWSFAGGRVLTLGFGDLFRNAKNPSLFLILSLLVFFIFYKFIFSKMAKKHLKRIVNSDLVKHCIFSFFDVKGYIIMAFMITGGISLRNSGIVNPIYLGSFYLGLGLALFLSGVLFFLWGVNFNKVRLQYINSFEITQ